MGGITDITARLGGTCPALALAAEELHANPDLFVAHGEVTLNYEPGTVSLNEEQGAVRFIDEPTLRLTARLNQTA